MGLLYRFPLSAEWTRSKKQYKKANTKVSILWFRLSLYTIQNQTQWTLTNFQATVLFLREVATGLLAVFTASQLQMERIQPFYESYSKALNVVNFRHYPTNQQLSQNEVPTDKS